MNHPPLKSAASFLLLLQSNQNVTPPPVFVNWITDAGESVITDESNRIDVV